MKNMVIKIGGALIEEGLAVGDGGGLELAVAQVAFDFPVAQPPEAHPEPEHGPDRAVVGKTADVFAGSPIQEDADPIGVVVRLRRLRPRSRGSPRP